MTKPIILNHHAASLLAYYVDQEKGLHFILEQKDPDYKPPFFDNGLNLIGGNWKKGVNKDKSPEELVHREIEEEFWMIEEPQEYLNELLGEKFLKREVKGGGKYDDKFLQRIKSVGEILEDGASYTTNYIVNISPPITKGVLTYGLTVFTNKLSAEEFKTIETVINDFKGKLITDNLKYDSKIVSVSLDEINKQNKKFAWGYGHILTDLIKSDIDTSSTGVIRPLNLIKINKIEYPIKGNKCPTFNDFERRGYEYAKNS